MKEKLISIEEWRKKQVVQTRKIVRRAKSVLKVGDKIRVEKCPGGKRTVTFAGWDGIWIVSRSGIRDFHPACVDRVNGKPADFGETLKIPEHLRATPGPLIATPEPPATDKYLISKGLDPFYVGNAPGEWKQLMESLHREADRFDQTAKNFRELAQDAFRKGDRKKRGQFNAVARAWKMAAHRVRTCDDIPF